MKNIIKNAPTDTTASLLGAILAVLSVFEIPTKLGLSPDDVGIILGSIATVAAGIRAKFVSGAKAE